MGIRSSGVAPGVVAVALEAAEAPEPAAAAEGETGVSGSGTLDGKRGVDAEGERWDQEVDWKLLCFDSAVVGRLSMEGKRAAAVRVPDGAGTDAGVGVDERGQADKEG